MIVSLQPGNSPRLQGTDYCLCATALCSSPGAPTAKRFSSTVVCRQRAVHGAYRADIAPFVEQRGVYGGWGGIDKALAVEGTSSICRSCASWARGGRGRAARGAGGPMSASRCTRCCCRDDVPRGRPMARQAAPAPRVGVRSCTPAIKCSRACCRL